MKDVNLLINNGVNINGSLELLGDMDTYNDVLKDFLDMIDEKISNLNKYKSINDMASYAIDVHSLKSDVRYLGFMMVGDLAYELELLSKQNDLVGVSGKHDNLINEVNKIVSACKKYLYGVSEEVTQTNEVTNTIDNNTALDPMSEALMYQGNISNNLQEFAEDENQPRIHGVFCVSFGIHRLLVCPDFQGIYHGTNQLQD